MTDPGPPRVLLTGMSGTGKSTVVAELVERGVRAMDLDDGYVLTQPDGTQRWDEAAVQAVLSSAHAPLVLAGCEENMGRFLPQFDHVVLLSAPRQVLVERLEQRRTNSFGKDPAELARILDDLERVEPWLRAVADVEIDTRLPLHEVVHQVLDLLARRHHHS